MSTVGPRISSGGVQLVVQAIDGIREEMGQVRGLWQEFGWGGLGEPRPPSEVRSNASFALVDLSTISGVDRRVSIRTT